MRQSVNPPIHFRPPRREAAHEETRLPPRSHGSGERIEPGNDEREPFTSDARTPDVRVAMLINAKSRRGHAVALTDEQRTRLMAVRRPRSVTQLETDFAELVEMRPSIIVVVGGDGTLRDVLSGLPAGMLGALPPIAIVPTGKTNALACDLGIPSNWTIDEAIEAARSGIVVQRAPIEVDHGEGGGRRLRGFVFGTNAFCRSVDLAQRFHHHGFFEGFAIILAIMGFVARSIFTPAKVEEAQTTMRVALSNGPAVKRAFYLILASTLERFPLGLRPFGRMRSGLKLLTVDAPPRMLLTSVLGVLLGLEGRWLRRNGYHRFLVDGIGIDDLDGFVLDGERFDATSVALRLLPPIDFVVGGIPTPPDPA